MNVHVTEVPWASHKERLRALRRTVFIEEQNVPQELEWDGADDDSRHFLAVTETGVDIGCARLMPSGQIGRMAVLVEHRGGGIGRDLLDVAVDTAAAAGFTQVFLHAQEHAEQFYYKAGFRRSGETFEEAGIPHISMEMTLPVLFDGEATAIEVTHRPASDRPQRPASIEPSQRFSGEADCRSAIVDALSAPRRELMIYSQRIDAALFDHADIGTVISGFVRGAQGARLNVLLHSTETLVGRSHAIVELARRISSKIAIRVVPYEMADADWSFVTWDRSGYLLLPDHREYEMVANPYDPVTASRLTDQFEQLWRSSREDPELRTLRL